MTNLEALNTCIKFKEALTKEQGIAILDNEKNIDWLDTLIAALYDKELIVGYEDDKVFLLSEEEYIHYQNNIPECRCGWWLRTPGFNASYAKGVSKDGDVLSYCATNKTLGIRPAIKYNYSAYLPRIGGVSTITYKERKYPATIIGIDCEKKEYIAIANVPIAFDVFNDEASPYRHSTIREFLLYETQARDNELKF